MNKKRPRTARHQRVVRNAAQHIRQQIVELSERLGVSVCAIECEVVAQSLACPRCDKSYVYGLELFKELGPKIEAAMDPNQLVMVPGGPGIAVGPNEVRYEVNGEGWTERQLLSVGWRPDQIKRLDVWEGAK